MASQAARGKKALDASDYETAILEYTAAIKESPTSPDFYIQRSTAYQRAGKNNEALVDAEQAVLNAQKRAKKESIVEAQFRRGIALYKLGQYGDAEFIFKRVKELKSDHKQADMWMNKTLLDLKKLEANDERRKLTVSETPVIAILQDKAADVDTRHTSINSKANNPSPSTAADPAPGSSAQLLSQQQTPAEKIRHEWYQNTQNVYFTLLAKGVPKDKAQIDISDRSMSISFPLLSGSSYDLTLDPLFAPVVPEKSIKRIMPSKVEIILIKANPGQKWSALETSEPTAVKPDSNAGSEDKEDPVKRAVLIDSKQNGPAYPTSSKSGPKDWDKISKEYSTASGDGKPGEDDDEEEGGDEANSFFKKLYKHSDPDTQRAMMKSYVESNGTALSTNWKEVSQGPVKTEPPDGMVAKEWNTTSGRSAKEEKD